MPPWLCPIRLTFALPLIATMVSIWSISCSPVGGRAQQQAARDQDGERREPRQRAAMPHKPAFFSRFACARNTDVGFDSKIETSPRI